MCGVRRIAVQFSEMNLLINGFVQDNRCDPGAGTTLTSTDWCINY
jgi:hypothetical protein